MGHSSNGIPNGKVEKGEIETSESMMIRRTHGSLPLERQTQEFFEHYAWVSLALGNTMKAKQSKDGGTMAEGGGVFPPSTGPASDLSPRQWLRYPFAFFADEGIRARL